jgi:AbrB family looped-hinge helix DNA binding protein
MSESIVKVTRKGQVTIPAGYRKRYKIREGTRVAFKDEDGKLVIEPITPIAELAGAGAGKLGIKTAKEMLDKMRAQDRF